MCFTFLFSLFFARSLVAGPELSKAGVGIDLGMASLIDRVFG